MSGPELFFERVERIDGRDTVEGRELVATSTAGIGVTERADGAGSRYRWAALLPGRDPEGPAGNARAPDALLRTLPAQARSAIVAPLSREPTTPGVDEAALAPPFETLRRLAREAKVALRITTRRLRREILVVGDSGAVTDLTDRLQLELRVTLDGAPLAWAQDERSYRDAEALAADVGDLSDRLLGLVETARSKAARLVDAPGGSLPVVIPPGADAGVLLHELCGHPLEGDVVLRGGSYLARRRRERVCAEHVTVFDDPTVGPGALSYGLDDEGTSARRVALIDRGVVTGTLTDARTATALGEPRSGHGRRLDFRHPPLPRMAHTALAPGDEPDERIVGDVERGIWISFLTPRFVHLLPGTFCFFVEEAREIVGGELGSYVAPCLLRGAGLEALRALEAVGRTSRPFFGLKGCGKLDQGGLPVSFANPAARFSSLLVEARR